MCGLDRTADLVADFATDRLRQLLDLAGFAALGDGGCVGNPSASFIDEGIQLFIFQNNEGLPVDDRSYQLVGHGRFAERRGGYIAQTLAVVLAKSMFLGHRWSPWS
jgi:hypothetical protein